jgi:hypothetical protein
MSYASTHGDNRAVNLRGSLTAEEEMRVVRGVKPAVKAPAQWTEELSPAAVGLPGSRRRTNGPAAAGSEKAAAHRLGLSHSTVKHHLANAQSKVGAATTAQLVWILAPRPPEPGSLVRSDE